MQISNIRLGHACNSSSSHSMILHAKPKSIKDSFEAGEFGWDNFKLASREAKLNYLFSTLFCNYSTFLAENESLELSRAFSGNTIEKELREEEIAENEEIGVSFKPYVDHQSLISIPKTFQYGGKINGLNWQFVKELRDFLLQDNLVILGGNDNSEGHPLLDKAIHTFNLNHIKDQEDHNLIARKEGDYWSIFYKKHGNRALFSFKQNPAPFKPSAPFLIDVKITDFCPFGCEFCYMGSTKEGLHSNINDIYSLFHEFSKNGVFEIAMGGGEPTLHPEFERIINTANDFGLSVNFTTKNKKWFRGEIFPRIASKIGKIAFSLERPDELEEIASAFRYHGVPLSKLNIQVIENVIDGYCFNKLVDLIKESSYYGVTITILGYKTNNRGKDFGRKVADIDWLKIMKEKSVNFCIDTILAQKYEEKLKQYEIPSYQYHVTEGTHSMYVDAVKKKVGKSSFCEDYIPYQEVVDIMPIFKSWQE